LTARGGAQKLIDGAKQPEGDSMRKTMYTDKNESMLTDYTKRSEPPKLENIKIKLQ